MKNRGFTLCEILIVVAILVHARWLMLLPFRILGTLYEWFFPCGL